jgi:pyrroline-5-carboxylate reductase
MSEANGIDVVMIGGGNMGAALLGGMLSSGEFERESLAVVERIDARRDELVEMFPGVSVVADVPPCRAAVIAVKPDGVTHAVEAAVQAGAVRLLSIAAGVKLSTLADAAGRNIAVVRAMPNTPALVGLGTAAIAGGAGATEGDLAWAESILGSVGIVERLDESLLDAFTGVAGSGPAYVFLFAEALIDAATAHGLDAVVAERIVAQLLLGSATLLDRDRDPARLRRNVTSPGGTTAAGLERFDAHDLRSIVADAVDAATARSRELG